MTRSAPVQGIACEDDLESEAVEAVQRVNFDWLHLSDGEDVAELDYEVEPTQLATEYKTATGESEPEVAPRYYDWKKLFPELQVLLDNYEILVQEMKSLTQSNAWTPWPEQKLYNGPAQNGDWNVVPGNRPFLYSFPAYDPDSSKWVDSNLKLCPKTAELLKSIPNIRTALYSRLGPNTRLGSHQGWADLANYVLRCHLPLEVPTSRHDLCGMWVENAVQYHKPKEILVFDDSKWHKAFNATEEDRVILIFDIMRPKSIPRGLATGGHTEDLDDFIAAFKQL